MKKMNIPYRINQIRTAQFAIFPNKYVNGDDVSVNANFNFAVSSDLTTIRCISSFTYSQNDNLLLTTEIQCFFGISPEGIEELSKEERVPVEFLRYMATIVTGTTRGIIHAKTENTVLNSTVLPPINLVEAIKNDLVINKSAIK